MYQGIWKLGRPKVDISEIISSSALTFSFCVLTVFQGKSVFSLLEFGKQHDIKKFRNVLAEELVLESVDADPFQTITY